MSEPLISIVIPAYNAENTLARAVHSICLNGTVSVQILVVENGSTDQTTDEANKFSSDDFRVLHSEIGVSRARNLGIQNAEGKWITFLDADDELVDDSLGKFSQFLQPDDPTVDIYILGIKGGSEKYIRNIDNKDKIRSYMKECMYFPTKKANNHGIIYRMDFLKKNNILFDDRLNYGEDSEFFLKSLAYAQHICVLDIPLYKVNYNEQSAVHHANCSMVTAYKKSIYKIQQNFFDRYDLSSDKILNNALNIYILNQLLIILTHETLAEKNGNVIREIHEIKQLANTEPFKHAVSESYIYEMSSITRVVFQMLKMKFYSGVWVAVRARQTQNKLGSDNK